jgi:hypothetical protein
MARQRIRVYCHWGTLERYSDSWRPISVGVHSCSSIKQEILQLHDRCVRIMTAWFEFPLTGLGWLTVIGWIAALTSVSFFVADLALQLVQLNSYFNKTGWQGTLLLWASLLLCVIINGALPVIEVVILIIHILGFFGILIPLVYLTPHHNTAKEVFTTFNNYGGWSSKALAFCIGLQGNALAFVGTDSPVHVSYVRHQ